MMTMPASSEQGLTVDVLEDDGILVVALAGVLDLATLPELRERLAGLDLAARAVAIDLSGLELLDSSGLGALLALRHQAEGRPLGVVLTPRLHRVFEITGLDDAFLIVPDRDSARAALAAASEPA
jgi:anti-sigma B factor antagonist